MAGCYKHGSGPCGVYKSHFLISLAIISFSRGAVLHEFVVCGDVPCFMQMLLNKL